jgi:large subunit ribosomal protein L25
MYGKKVDPRNFSVPYLDFSRLYKEAGESTLVELSVEGKSPVNVLIHDVQLDPLTGRFTHIDFYQVNMAEKIETDVPLEFVGEAPAVKELGGVLIRALEEVLVKCLPKDLPHALPIDLSVLKTFDHTLKVADISLPKGVEMLEDLTTIVATVMPPRTEAEMASLEEKVEMDVTKVEGIVKEESKAEGEGDKATAGKEEK